VVVTYDDTYQPIGEASALLTGVCGLLEINHVLLPISFERRSTMPDTYKDHVWERALKVIEPTLNICSVISFIQCRFRLTFILFEDSIYFQDK